MKFKRIMLKLSGDVFSGRAEYGIHREAFMDTAKQVLEVSKKGIELVIVVGGGNIWRYRDTKENGIERTSSDAMGMLATIMNSVALQSALESMGAETRVLSAVAIPQLAEPFIKRRALRHLEKGRIVICAGEPGTHTSRRIPPLLCGRWNSPAMSSSRPRTSMVSTTKTPISTRMP